MNKLFIASLLTGWALSLPLFGAEVSRSRQLIKQAIESGNLVDVKQELGKQGFLDLNAPVDQSGRTLLRYAINQLAVSKGIIQALVNAGAQVGDAWKRVPEKDIYDMDLIKFLTNHPSATNLTFADVDGLEAVPFNIKYSIKQVVPKQTIIPPHLQIVDPEALMKPITGLD
jgi:hypothetical protein